MGMIIVGLLIEAAASFILITSGRAASPIAIIIIGVAVSIAGFVMLLHGLRKFFLAEITEELRRLNGMLPGQVRPE